MSLSADIRVLFSRLIVALIGPLLIGFVFYDPIKSAISDVVLRFAGVSTSALILSAEEEPEMSDEGQTIWFYWITYSFKNDDGQVIYGSASGTGRIGKFSGASEQQPIPAFVDYLPANPSINSVRSSENHESTLRLAFRALLTAVIVFGWIWYLCHSIVELFRELRTRKIP